MKRTFKKLGSLLILLTFITVNKIFEQYIDCGFKM